MRKRLAMAALLLTPLMTCLSCSKSIFRSSYWDEDRCLQCIIQKELNSNPKLEQRKIGVRVFVNNRYAQLTITGGSSLSESTLSALRSGETLQDISLHSDKSVDALIEAEEIIKKATNIKAISFESKFGCNRQTPINF